MSSGQSLVMLLPCSKSNFSMPNSKDQRLFWEWEKSSIHLQDENASSSLDQESNRLDFAQLKLAVHQQRQRDEV